MTGLNIAGAKHGGGANRWRGKLPVPSHADPLVRELFKLMNKDCTVITEVAERAGIGRAVISNWRYRSAPQLPNFVAVVNALGYEVKIVPIGKGRQRKAIPE